MLSKIVLGGVAAHVTISFASLIHATTCHDFTSESASVSSLLTPSDKNEKFIAQKVVESMYDNCLVGPKELLDDNVVFEDPVALCMNRKEVKNAFFLLKYISPVRVSRTLYDIRNSEEMQNRKIVIFDQRQQYSIGRELILHSHVVVDIDT